MSGLVVAGRCCSLAIRVAFGSTATIQLRLPAHGPASPCIACYTTHTHLLPPCRRATRRIACRPGVGGAMIPRTCDAAVLPGQANTSGTDPYILLAERAA